MHRILIRIMIKNRNRKDESNILRGNLTSKFIQASFCGSVSNAETVFSNLIRCRGAPLCLMAQAVLSSSGHRAFNMENTWLFSLLAFFITSNRPSHPFTTYTNNPLNQQITKPFLHANRHQDLFYLGALEIGSAISFLQIYDTINFFCTWKKWGLLWVWVIDAISTSATLRTWYEKSRSSKCSCCPSKYIMVQPPQATESPSTSWLLGGTRTESSRYHYNLRITC